MANYGKYYIAVRLLLLKQYLEANAGRNRIVKRRELEQILEEHDMPVEKKTLYADFAALWDVCGLQQAPCPELLSYGKIADKYIRQMNTFYDHLSVDKYVIMPDHIHFLISIHEQVGHPGRGVPTGEGFCGIAQKKPQPHQGI